MPVNHWIMCDLNQNIDGNSLADVEIIDPDSYIIIMQSALAVGSCSIFALIV